MATGLLGFWVGGANKPTGIVSTGAHAGVKSMLAFWMGGACTPQPPVVTPEPTAPPSAGGVGRYPGAWRKHYYSGLPKKKKKLVDDLDEILAELRSRIVEEPTIEAAPAWVDELRRGYALAESELLREATLAEIRAQIGRLEAIAREMDDEETILLALH